MHIELLGRLKEWSNYNQLRSASRKPKHTRMDTCQHLSLKQSTATAATKLHNIITELIFGP